MSPTSERKGGVADETLALQIQQFLDEYHFRIIHCSLGKTTSRKKIVASVLDILEINGVELSPKERDSFIDCDERVMVEHLVQKFPIELRTGFENLAQQLMLVMTSMTRIRHGIEADDVAEINEVLEADKEQVVKNVLKQAVVVASKEVAKIRRCEQTWSKNMAKRIARLQSAEEMAEHAQQQLIATEAQISVFCDSQTQKSKKMLTGMAGKNDKVLMHSAFSAWLGDHMKVMSEKVIRDKYEAEAEAAEKRLLDYQEKQVKNVRNILMKSAKGEDQAMLVLMFDCWAKDVKARKDEGGTKSEMDAVQARLDAYAKDQKDATMRTMQRMAAANDENLIAMVFQGFVKYREIYLQDKEMEDAVKLAEAKVKEHMEKKKEEAKGVLDRMAGASDTGLLSQCITNWAQFVKDEKKDREMENLLHEQTSKFKALADRQKGSATGMQNNVNEQMKQNLVLKSFAGWQLEVKVARIDKYYTSKIEGKRKQLQSVQSLFKSFAAQLEQGLNAVEGDSSGRTAKSNKRSSKDPVSLPPIDQRP